MLAIIYLFLIIYLGDLICRRIFPFISIPQRLATAILSGMLISAWGTYISAWLFSSTDAPMLWGNLLFGAIVLAAITFLLNREYDAPTLSEENSKLHDDKWDWVLLGIFFVFVTWLVFLTFSFDDGKLKIAHHQWSDFGSNVSIMQSFALGHNFPTEYPHFAGDRIRYHFLFYFLAGNLEYLGLNPALANNILSILSWMSMLALIMAFGSIVFSSKAVGRIAAGLFFCHGSYSIITYLTSKDSVWNAILAIPQMRDFLNSGFPYRGETWGVWSQVVFLNQRHLTSSIGILLIVICFLAIRYKDRWSERIAAHVGSENEPLGRHPDAAGDASEELDEKIGEDDIPAAGTDRPEMITASLPGDLEGIRTIESSAEAEPNSELVVETAETPEEIEAAVESDTDQRNEEAFEWRQFVAALPPFLFCGFLLGLSPMWNSAVFVSAFFILAAFFLLFPFRPHLLALAAVTGVFSIPQVLYLKGGDLPDTGVNLFTFGYTISPPTYYGVIEYLAYTFALKWPLILIGLFAATWFQRKLFIAFCSLFLVTFFLLFSAEALTNHKFLNVWLIFANAFAAAGIVYLWRCKNKIGAVIGRTISVVLCSLILFGGIADLFPLKNSFWMYLPYEDDELVDWVKNNTDPRSRFLSFRYVNHGILVAGRRLFHGHTYYSWGAGYPVTQRDELYKKMFTEKDPEALYKMLRDNNIDYVAFDDQLRNGDFPPRPNEAIFAMMFDPVFTDSTGKYGKLIIYEVPSDVSKVRFGLTRGPNSETRLPPTAIVNAFVGGEGRGGGQFVRPRGIAVDATGNIYVADTGNSRIQKFDAEGAFLFDFGDAGDGPGRLKEPNGVAVDRNGNIFVTDASRNRLIKYNAKGEFIKEWTGTPDQDFYGPRDIAIDANGDLYIVDQGRTRIVKFNPKNEIFHAWGSRGDGPGQFVESTGIDVGGGKVFVADNGNGRIQVFDLNGRFIRQWEVPAWEKYVWNYPDIVFDEVQKLLYVTNPWKNELLAYDLEGVPQPSPVLFSQPQREEHPTAMCISRSDAKPRLLILRMQSSNILKIDLSK